MGDSAPMANLARVPSTSTSPVPASSSRKLAAIQNAGNKIRGIGRQVGAQLMARNDKLREQLANADPESVPLILGKELPSLLVNAGLSAADSSEVGKTVAEATKIDPSTMAFGVSLIGLFLIPKKSRGLRRAARTALKGAAHTLAGKMGRRVPDAVRAGTKAQAKTSGTDEGEPVT